MRFKLISTIIFGLALSGCETSSDGSRTIDNSAASGSGSTKVSVLKSSGIKTRRSDLIVPPGTQEDLVVNVGDRVFFSTDSFQLSAESRAVLERQAKWLGQNLGTTFSIEGHADERGTREYNLALGERRASAVRDYLVALGVNPNRIQTISFGKERPVDPRSLSEAWSKNRRGVSVVK